MELDSIIRNKSLSIDDSIYSSYKYCCFFKTKADTFMSAIFNVLCDKCCNGADPHLAECLSDYHFSDKEEMAVLNIISKFIEYCLTVQNGRRDYSSAVQFMLVHHKYLQKLFKSVCDNSKDYEDSYVLSTMIGKTGYTGYDICCYCQSVNDVVNMDVIDYMYVYLLLELDIMPAVVAEKCTLVNNVNSNVTMGEYYEQIADILRMRFPEISEEEIAICALSHLKEAKLWD